MRFGNSGDPVEVGRARADGLEIVAWADQTRAFAWNVSCSNSTRRPAIIRKRRNAASAEPMTAADEQLWKRSGVPSQNVVQRHGPVSGRSLFTTVGHTLAE
jgi:hypothetical protein